MAISNNQLKTWSNQGATAISSAAYASISHALTKSTSPLADRTLNIFLQGSYANSTHIYSDSDIDVVVLYENTFHKDWMALTEAQRQVHEQTYGPAEYLWEDLRRDVLAALRAHYGHGAVTEGNKAIKVQTAHGRMVADVVPAVEFRRYAHFNSRHDHSAHWGIHFRDSRQNPIVNYPKYHIDRGQEKNAWARTQEKYKPTIRVFKNFRNYMVENGLLADGIAPSYFLECALHNVPDSTFVGEFDQTIPAIIQYLFNVPFDDLWCQNGVTKLIGATQTQWPKENFTAFVVAADNAWRNW